MTDKIKHFFKHNIGLKLISLVIAFGIWIMVVNISNPEIGASVNATIDIDYGESLTNLDKYYSLDTSTAKVSFKVRTNQRNSVKSSDFKVYVDMRDYSITGALPVYVEANDSVKDIVSDVNVSPVVVHATTEDMQEKAFDLTADIKGEPGEGYAVGNISFTPNRVTLYGPNSEIGKISRIGFDVDVTDAVDSIWGIAEFKYYDANDNMITPDVRIVVKNSVSYVASIYRKKNVSITAQTYGDPAPGYTLDSVNCDPGFVEIYADDEVLDSINAIILPASLLNISGAVGDVSASIDISKYLPENVYTDTVTNVALVARISKNSLIPPVMDSPEGNSQTVRESSDSKEEGAEASASESVSTDTAEQTGKNSSQKTENEAVINTDSGDSTDTSDGKISGNTASAGEQESKSSDTKN